jgi:hypothetical protein
VPGPASADRDADSAYVPLCATYDSSGFLVAGTSHPALDRVESAATALGGGRHGSRLRVPV